MAPLKKKKRLNLAEILDDLEENSQNIYIQPPEDVNEPSDDEFDEENCNVFSKKLLQLPAEKKASRIETIRESPMKLRKRPSNIFNNCRGVSFVKIRVNNDNSVKNSKRGVSFEPVIKKSVKRRDNNDNSEENSTKRSVITQAKAGKAGNDNSQKISSDSSKNNSKNRICDNSSKSSNEGNNDNSAKNSKKGTVITQAKAGKAKKFLKRKASNPFTENCDLKPPKRRKIKKNSQILPNVNNKFRKKVLNKGKNNDDDNCGESTKNNGIHWSIGGETDVSQTEFGFTVTSTDINNMDATDYFELFFDDTLLELIIYESSQYCHSKNWPDINLCKAELRTFFAILIISGYNPLPSKAMYWYRGKDMRNDAIYESMRRDRFNDIMKSLHFASEENLDTTDKYSKLRPIISHLQKKFMKHFSPTEAISHDEAMVEYFGHHGCKQSIRDKPIRFGYKVFCHNTPSGYLVAFDTYQGKTYQGDEEMEKQFGKSASSLLNILDSYPINKSVHPYHFYCDNYFTSIPLCKELKSRGYNCTGTIRANRVGKDCPLTDVKEFAKKERGSTEVATANVVGDKVFVSRWKDNSVVTVASTRFAANPEGFVKRWCKTDKKHIQVPIPHAINNYNRNMGGTDRTDQNVNAYRVSIRGKKWWWPLFTWMLDVSVQNAWQLARKQNSNLVQLQYRRDLAISYLSAYSQPPKAAGRKRKMDIENESSSDSMRFDKIGHFVRNTGNNKPRRCRGNNCRSKVRTECLKCDVGLCIPCFESYHIV